MINKLVGSCLGALLCMTHSLAHARIEYGGSVAIEQRFFLQDPLYLEQTKSQMSLALSPEISTNLGDNGLLTFKPFARVDQRDDERSKVDIREFMLAYYFDSIEVHAGIGKVFWGQTESLHLVDIINQTDFIESIDSEEKLGQAMLEIRFLSDFGTLSAFALPHFREMTFPGLDGRLRGPLAVDHDFVSYESEDEDTHLDWALRWQHSIGSWEVGLGYFDGTSRLPELSVVQNPDTQEFVISPRYNLLTQASIDLLYVYDAWLFKLEAINGDTLNEQFNAAVAGFEYTLGDFYQTGYDLGVLMEYQYDERDENPLITGQNDLMLGARLQLNDFASSEILFAFVQDMDESASYSGVIEGSTRISQNWRLEVNAYLFSSDEPSDPVYQFRRDDHVTINFEYYF
jgi:hypothetical protein